MHAEPTADSQSEADRLDAAILDLEARAKLVDEEAQRAREEALAKEAEARDVHETLNGMRRHRERIGRQSAAQDKLTLLPDPAPISPANSSVNLAPPPQREDGILAIIGRDLRTWTYQELQDEFVRRGWNNPKAKHEIAAIRAAIYRLAKFGRVELGPQRGEFRFKMPPTTTTPDTGGDGP